MRGLKFPEICLIGQEIPEKLHPGSLSRPGIEPGPAVSSYGKQRHHYHGLLDGAV